jgi:hypothetical protein
MPDPALPWRPEFLAALRLLARVSEAMAARGLPRPVLVGRQRAHDRRHRCHLARPARA